MLCPVTCKGTFSSPWLTNGTGTGSISISECDVVCMVGNWRIKGEQGRLSLLDSVGSWCFIYGVLGRHCPSHATSCSLSSYAICCGREVNCEIRTICSSTLDFSSSNQKMEMEIRKWKWNWHWAMLRTPKLWDLSPIWGTPTIVTIQPSKTLYLNFWQWQWRGTGLLHIYWWLTTQ